jgi:hypothetical protein
VCISNCNIGLNETKHDKYKQCRQCYSKKNWWVNRYKGSYMHCLVYMHFFLVYTFAHNKDQMFTPSMRKIYGSEFQVLQLDNSARQLSQIFALSKTHWKTLNNEEEPCNATQYSDTSSCIAMYIDNKLSCYFPLYKIRQVKKGIPEPFNIRVISCVSIY